MCLCYIFFNINGFCLGSQLTCPKSPHFRGLVTFFPYLTIHYPWFYPLAHFLMTVDWPGLHLFVWSEIIFDLNWCIKQSFRFHIMNYWFLTTETNFKAINIFRRFNTTSSVKLFEVTVQIFVYKLLFFGKMKKPHETFHTIFTFWKRKHIL